jgi:outer membrane protein TolC
MAKQIQETTDVEEKLAEIKSLQKRVNKMREELEQAKENTKVAREAWEAAVDHLGAVILDAEDRPLLDAEGGEE